MKIFKSILLGICVVACIVFVILFGTQMFKSNKSDVSVSQEITITSKVTNVVQQTYASTVKGAVRNNTNSQLKNVKMLVYVQTKALKHKETLTIEIGDIQAGEEIIIDKVFDTKQNFEEVKEVRYQIGSQKNKFIANGEGVVFNGWAILYVIPAALFGILSIKLAVSVAHERKRVVVHTTQPAPKPSSEETLAYIITQQQENERRRIELEKQRVNVDLARTEMEKQKEDNARPRYCSYCGTKNDASATKCVNCGSNMQ